MIIFVGLVYGMAAVNWAEFYQEHFYCPTKYHSTHVRDYLGDREGKFRYVTEEGEEFTSERSYRVGDRLCITTD